MRVQPQPTQDGASDRAERAKEAADYGRRDKGRLSASHGRCIHASVQAPNQRHWVNFLEQVDGLAPPEADRVYVILITVVLQS